MTRYVAKRIRYRTESLLLSIAMLGIPLQANAHAPRCAAGLTTNPVRFESALKYDDMQGKANPAVHVRINGKPVKMLLATGSNSHVIWDESLLDEKPGPGFRKLDAASESGGAGTVKLTVADDHGNVLQQDFYLMADSALAEDGFSGALSPQVIAGLDAVVVDFEKNCFFTTAPFDFKADKGLQVLPGKTIQNADDVMAISVGLDGRAIPVGVSTGSSNTMIQDSLVASKPPGSESPRMMDIYKKQIQKTDHMRLVDLKINGEVFKSLPVVPMQQTPQGGVPIVGQIGMDVLKERVIYYNAARQEFFLASRKEPNKQAAGENEIRMN
jgi:hypothetical protein